MRKLTLISLVLMLASIAHAGVVRFGYKHIAKPGLNHVVKPAAKVASFPVRHPKKDLHAAGKSAKFASKVIF